MERLTDKNHRAINTCGEYSSCYACHREICYISELEHKLGELEDVLEKYNIESVEELDLILQGLEKVHQENANLKNELVELKQKAIVPKFKVNQEIWYYHIGKNKIYSGIVEDMQWRPVNGMYYRIPNLQRDYFWIREDELFATREEAEQKLAEIGGKDE